MAIEFVHPRYPNYTFLQLEEVNQVIYNYTKNGYENRSCIYSSKILKAYPELGENNVINKPIKDLRYNFTIINLEFDSKGRYVWYFEIVNTLWTGGYSFTSSDGSKIDTESYEITAKDTNNVTNTKGNFLKIVTKKNITDWRLCLDLSNADLPRNIIEHLVYHYRFEKSSYEFTQQFDESMTRSFRIISEPKGGDVDDMKVRFVSTSDPSLLEKGMPDNSGFRLYNKKNKNYVFDGVSKGNGVYNITFDGAGTCVDCYGRLECRDKQTNALLCTANCVIHMVQGYERSIELLTSSLSIPKGSKGTLKYKVTLKYKGATINKKTDFTGNVVNIYHTFNANDTNPLKKTTTYKEKTNVYTTLVDKDNTFSFTIDCRGFYGDTSKLVVSLQKTDYFEALVSEPLTLTHDWKRVNSLKELSNELASEDGSDCIVLTNKVYNRTKSDTTIKFTRESSNLQYILGEKGDGWATIHGNYLSNLISLDTHPLHEKQGTINNVILAGIAFYENECTITQNDYTNLKVMNCVFKYNRYLENNYQGCCIYQNSKNTTTTVENSYFEDNYANCLLGRGVMNATDSLFRINHVKYTYQPEPFVLEQYEGVGTLKRNQFYINTSLTWDANGKPQVSTYSKNRSYAKIATWTGNTATINGKTRHDLGYDGAFNYFDEPYSNHAYIFSAYWYPYDIQAYIVASAPNNRINKATGHAFYGTNWAYKDGYNLTRVSWNSHNTYNPFVKFVDGKKIEDATITVPSAGGVV